MRGMTSSGGNSATVGFYLDDVPLAGPASAQNGHVVIDPDLYDLNRIEILRGPQGTLFGSGSMGGTVQADHQPAELVAVSIDRAERLIGHRRRRVQSQGQLDGQPPPHRRHLGTTGRGNRRLYERLDRPHRGGPISPGRWKPGRHRARRMSRTRPITKQYPGSNAYQIYAARVTLLWKPTENLSVTPSYFHTTSTQNGISAYDSVPGTLAHYQPFDIAEPLTDSLTAYSLNVNYSFRDVRSDIEYRTMDPKLHPGRGGQRGLQQSARSDRL